MINKPIVTIAVPHYRTLTLTKFCLRLLRQHTREDQIEVIVIDNNSQDQSTEWLRSLSWIKLVERENIPGDPPHICHGRALDLALAMTTTPYFLSIHTDTLVKNSGWLDFLLKKINVNDNIAGVGSWKLEHKTLLQCTLKWLERRLQKLWSTISYQPNQPQPSHYLRSHCALYRVAAIRQHQLSFVNGQESAGMTLHHKLVAAGYQMCFLSSEELSPYLEHVNHATMILNPELGMRQRNIKQGRRRVKQALTRVQAQQILANDQLDY